MNTIKKIAGSTMVIATLANAQHHHTSTNKAAHPDAEVNHLASSLLNSPPSTLATIDHPSTASDNIIHTQTQRRILKERELIRDRTANQAKRAGLLNEKMSRQESNVASEIVDIEQAVADGDVDVFTASYNRRKDDKYNSSSKDKSGYGKKKNRSGYGKNKRSGKYTSKDKSTDYSKDDTDYSKDDSTDYSKDSYDGVKYDSPSYDNKPSYNSPPSYDNGGYGGKLRPGYGNNGGGRYSKGSKRAKGGGYGRPNRPGYGSNRPNRPSYNKPSYDSPSYDKPSYDSPSYDKPSYDSPSYDKKSSDSYDSPSYDKKESSSSSYDKSYDGGDHYDLGYNGGGYYDGGYYYGKSGKGSKGYGYGYGKSGKSGGYYGGVGPYYDGGYHHGDIKYSSYDSSSSSESVDWGAPVWESSSSSSKDYSKDTSVDWSAPVWKSSSSSSDYSKDTSVDWGASSKSKDSYKSKDSSSYDEPTWGGASPSKDSYKSDYSKDDSYKSKDDYSKEDDTYKSKDDTYYSKDDGMDYGNKYDSVDYYDTDEPTMFPTLSPTLDPTLSPTLSPSWSPTLSPTLSPSLSPTLSPTLEPTQSPEYSSKSWGSSSSSKDKWASSSSGDDWKSSSSGDSWNSPSKDAWGNSIDYSKDDYSKDTDGPTLSPSFSPTLSPTFPTLSPTLNPTLSPTFAPTENVAFVTAVNDPGSCSFDKDKCSLYDDNEGLCNGFAGSFCLYDSTTSTCLPRATPRSCSDLNAAQCAQTLGRCAIDGGQCRPLTGFGRRDLQTTEDGCFYFIADDEVTRRLPVLANDKTNREIFVKRITTDPSFGTCTVTDDGQAVRYTRSTDLGASTTDTFCRYEACTIPLDSDEEEECSKATIRIRAQKFFDPDFIVARPDLYYIRRDFTGTSNRLYVLDNDFVPDGRLSDVKLSITAQPGAIGADIARGTCSIRKNSGDEFYVIYSVPSGTPPVAAAAEGIITRCRYEACLGDDKANCKSATISIQFLGSAASPIVKPDVDVAGGLTIAGIEPSTEEAAPTCDERVKKGIPVSDEFKTCCAYEKPEGSSTTKRDFCKSLGCRVAKCP